jgi:Flp pilus assembly protein TadG
VLGDRGTVTAEFATCLPVLVLLLAVALSAVSVAGQRVRMQDAAREAARAAARGDDATARRLAHQYAPGATVSIDRSGGQVTVVAGGSMHLLARWLPSVTVTARAVAAIEPDVDGSDGGYGRTAGVPP